MSEQENIAQSSVNFVVSPDDEIPSRLSAIIFVLICVMPGFSAVAFGAVDLWALGVLSFFAGVIVLLWLADAWFKKNYALV